MGAHCAQECIIHREIWYSLYVTGALPAVALVLNPRVGRSAKVLSPCRSFKQRLLKIQQFLLLPQTQLVVTARSYGDLPSWCWNPGLYGLAWSWDPSPPSYPSQLLSTTHECGTSCSTAYPCHTMSHASPPISTSLTLLPI